MCTKQQVSDRSVSPNSMSGSQHSRQCACEAALLVVTCPVQNLALVASSRSCYQLCSPGMCLTSIARLGEIHARVPDVLVLTPGL